MNYTYRRTTRRARGPRRTQTESEKRLWGYLRDRRLGGHKFVRQEPAGPFLANFLCREKRLIVEVDGATHSEDREIAYDTRRTAYLERDGYQVLRILSADVFSHMPDVLDTILLAFERQNSTR